MEESDTETDLITGADLEGKSSGSSITSLSLTSSPLPSPSPTHPIDFSSFIFSPFHLSLNIIFLSISHRLPLPISTISTD